MKKFVVMIIALFATGTLFAINADAQWRSETHDVYEAPTGVEIEIDGNLDDWEGVLDSVTGTDGSTFCGVGFDAGGTVEVWEPLGGTWDGPEDHTTCFMIVWDADAVYLALDVTDDEHEHAAGGAWNGDGVQLSVVPSGIRESGSTFFLYNVALRDNGDLILNNESTHGLPGLTNADFAIVRDDDAKKTYYELKFTPANFGQSTALTEGVEIGLGICVNDGDKNALGQKGWSGWYPRAIVHGKNPELTGLVVLTNTHVTSVDPKDKLTSTWGRIKSDW